MMRFPSASRTSSPRNGVIMPSASAIFRSQRSDLIVIKSEPPAVAGGLTFIPCAALKQKRVINPFSLSPPKPKIRMAVSCGWNQRFHLKITVANREFQCGAANSGFCNDRLVRERNLSVARLEARQQIFDSSGVENNGVYLGTHLRRQL